MYRFQGLSKPMDIKTLVVFNGRHIRIELGYHNGRVSTTDWFYQRCEIAYIGLAISYLLIFAFNSAFKELIANVLSVP